MLESDNEADIREGKKTQERRKVDIVEPVRKERVKQRQEESKNMIVTVSSSPCSFIKKIGVLKVFRETLYKQFIGKCA